MENLNFCSYFPLSDSNTAVRVQQDLLDSNREKQGEVNTDDFVANLYQLEIDRIQYIISSYLRTRLQKVDQFLFLAAIGFS